MFNRLLELPLVAHSCGLVAAVRACTIYTEVISSALTTSFNKRDENCSILNLDNEIRFPSQQVS